MTKISLDTKKSPEELEDADVDFDEKGIAEIDMSKVIIGLFAFVFAISIGVNVYLGLGYSNMQRKSVCIKCPYIPMWVS